MQVYAQGMNACASASHLKLFYLLAQISSIRTDRFRILNARDVTSGDFRNPAAIVCWAPPYNPLLIEGVGYAGVDASLSFPCNGKKMAPIIAGAKGPEGKPSNFQGPIGAPFIKDSAGCVCVVATRFYPNNG